MVFKKDICIFALLGLILGIIIDQLIGNPNVDIFYPVLASLFCYLYVLSYDEKNRARLIGSSLIVALFLSIPFIGINVFHSLPDSIRWLTFLAAFPVFAYIGHCFHYAYHHDNTWKVNYSTLFAAVWNTILLGVVALIFSVIAHILIMLAAFIFKTVGSLYLWNLYFENMHFRLICGFTLFFLGIGVGQQNLELIYNLRFLLLKMMYFLFPFLALISCIYFVLYWVHSFSAQPEYVNSIVVLVPLTVLGILFFNAYFQDGTAEKDTPTWLKNSLKVYRVVLFLLAVLLFYKISKEISLNINSLIYLFFVLLFTLTYAITAFLPENEEVFWIRMGNIGTALFFVIALFLVNLPYLSKGSNDTFKIEKQLQLQSNMNGTTKNSSSPVLKAYRPATP